jgi:hypothetical protein
MRQPEKAVSCSPNASNARYTQGHLVFAREHTIHAVPFDLETLTLRGEPRPLGMSVIQSLEAPNTWFVNGAAQFAVSDTGDLAYRAGNDLARAALNAGVGDPRGR